MTSDEEKKLAEDIYFKILSPPLDDDGEMSEEQRLAWIDGVNNMIRTKLDFFSLCALLQVAEEHELRHKGFSMALKRHAENHSMKEDVFVWLDANRKNYKSMDAAAQAITKQQPIAFRTAREWVGEWKKLRSAGTP